MDTIKYQLNARRQPYGRGVDLSLLNESVGNEVLAFHQNFLITGSRRCVGWNFKASGWGWIDPYKDEAQRFGFECV